MDYQREPKQGSAESKETRQQVARTISTRSRTGSNAKSVDVAHENAMFDYADEDEEVYTSQQTSARRSFQHGKHGPQRGTGVRISERPEQVERNAVGLGPSSHGQGQKSSDLRARGRPGQPGHGPNVPKLSSRLESHQVSPNIQEQEDPRWHRLPDRVDGLSAEMRIMKNAIMELQRDRDGKAALQNELNELQAKLHETETNAQTFQTKWKRVASELGKFKSQSQQTGLYHLADSDLAALVRQLRFDVQNFSLQYFLGKAPRQSGDLPENEFWKYMVETTPGSDDYHAYLRDEASSPVVIMSFLWRLLVGEVFEKFLWVPQPYESITLVYQGLKPYAINDENGREIPTAPEAERKFQMWKATTSALILEQVKSEDERGVQETVEDVSKRVLGFMSPFVRNSNEDILNYLGGIIERSIALDKEICRQAARFDWIFPSQVPATFNPAYMEVEPRGVAPSPGENIGVVTAPALKKRGKSTGEDFEREDILLKMVVASVHCL